MFCSVNHKSVHLIQVSISTRLSTISLYRMEPGQKLLAMPAYYAGYDSLQSMSSFNVTEAYIVMYVHIID